jgi:hypothetical protein
LGGAFQDNDDDDDNKDDNYDDRTSRDEEHDKDVMARSIFETLCPPED